MQPQHADPLDRCQLRVRLDVHPAGIGVQPVPCAALMPHLLHHSLDLSPELEGQLAAQTNSLLKLNGDSLSISHDRNVIIAADSQGIRQGPPSSLSVPGSWR
ncbi:MAG: hypothetical protein WKF51_10320 [Geodermatophilaceae bacterium]